MGTRGAVGFRWQQRDYLTYNHFDSYPDGLGANVASFVVGMLAGNERAVQRRVDSLVLVDEQSKPTLEQAEKLQKHTDTRVSTGDDWYAILRNTQGDLNAVLEAGHMVDSHEFMQDSLFCEYAYIVNLDDRTLEFYRGFQKDPEKIVGRYARPREDWGTDGRGEPCEYGPVTLLRAIPFHEIEEAGVELIVAEMNHLAKDPDEEDDDG